MQFGILITNNSLANHPADKWAEATVGRITAVFDIDENSGSEEARKARRDRRTFEADLIEKFTSHHQTVNDRELAHLSSKGDERLKDSLDAVEQAADVIEAAYADVLEAAKINPLFFAYFSRPDVAQHVKHDMLAVDFTSSMHINRRYHCDHNPNSEVVQAWEKASRSNGAGHAHFFMLDHLVEKDSV